MLISRPCGKIEHPESLSPRTMRRESVWAFLVEMMGLEPTTPCLQSPLGRMTMNVDEPYWLVRAVAVQRRTTANDGARAMDARWSVRGPHQFETRLRGTEGNQEHQ